MPYLLQIAKELFSHHPISIAFFHSPRIAGHLNRSSQGYTVVLFGLTNDKPIPADFDGDGKTDLAVFRPSEGNWYIRNSASGNVQIVNWGLATDALVPADYDGDGKADVAIFRDGTWWIRQSTSGISIQQFGLANDKPVPSSFSP